MPIAARFSTTGLQALCDHADGVVALADGDTGEAISDAELHARRGCSEMDDFVSEHTGLAFYTVGEILRLKDDLDAAEDAFRRADELGRAPLELDAARAPFERLGAADLSRRVSRPRRTRSAGRPATGGRR